MFEYITVLLIVGIAVYFTARKLWFQTKICECSNCYCQLKGKKIEESCNINKDCNP
jgi:hypothetical protein